MSLQLHCDNCDKSLTRIDDRGREVAEAAASHTAITYGPDHGLGGRFPSNRHDFCNDTCLGLWAMKRDESAGLPKKD